MSAQSWIVKVVPIGNEVLLKGKERDYECHSVFAPNPDNAKKQLENRGYTVLDVSEGHFFQNVNSSAEFKNI